MRSILPLLFVFSFILSATGADEASLKVMSFNIRFGTANDGDNAWEHRQQLVVDTIKQFDPDLLGLQESVDFQTEYIAKHLKDFGMLGTSREVEPGKGEGVPIFYRKSRFEVIEQSDFWLSETPGVRGSMGWDAACPRIVTWAKLKDLSCGKTLVFASTHFDHRGKQAREESAKLLRKKIDEWLLQELPTVVLGDFNCIPGSAPHVTLLGKDTALPLVDSFRAANPEKTNQESTISKWTDNRTDPRRIDWILHSEHFRSLRALINFTNDRGRYPSDHYPVESVLRY